MCAHTRKRADTHDPSPPFVLPVRADFLEALCRATDLQSVPTDEDMERMGTDNAAVWDSVVSPDERLQSRRPSVGWFGVTNRHLPEKLDKYLTMLLARLSSVDHR